MGEMHRFCPLNCAVFALNYSARAIAQSSHNSCSYLSHYWREFPIMSWGQFLQTAVLQIGCHQQAPLMLDRSTWFLNYEKWSQCLAHHSTKAIGECKLSNKKCSLGLWWSQRKWSSVGLLWPAMFHFKSVFRWNVCLVLFQAAYQCGGMCCPAVGGGTSMQRRKIMPGHHQCRSWIITTRMSRNDSSLDASEATGCPRTRSSSYKCWEVIFEQALQNYDHA